MPTLLSPTELQFIQAVDCLGLTGLTQRDVAAQLEIPLETLRGRVLRLGLRLVPACRVLDIRTGRTLTELLDSGELGSDTGAS